MYKKENFRNLDKKYNSHLYTGLLGILMNYCHKKLEVFRKKDQQRYWDISLEYSTLLNNHSNNRQLCSVVSSIQGMYLKKLKSEQLQNFECSVWKEIDVHMKKKHVNNLKQSIHKLHITNLYHV